MVIAKPRIRNIRNRAFRKHGCSKMKHKTHHCFSSKLDDSFQTSFSSLNLNPPHTLVFDPTLPECSTRPESLSTGISLILSDSFTLLQPTWGDNPFSLEDNATDAENDELDTYIIKMPKGDGTTVKMLRRESGLRHILGHILAERKAEDNTTDAENDELDTDIIKMPKGKGTPNKTARIEYGLGHILAKLKAEDNATDAENDELDTYIIKMPKGDGTTVKMPRRESGLGRILAKLTAEDNTTDAENDELDTDIIKMPKGNGTPNKTPRRVYGLGHILAKLRAEGQLEPSLPLLPDSFSWLEKNPGCIGPVRQQIGGTCLPEALIASLEALNALNSGTFESFSVQELAEKCANYEKFKNASKWIIEHGVSLRSDYPDREFCQTPIERKEDWKIFRVKGYKTFHGHEERQMMSALMTQPLTATLRWCCAFQNLGGGVYRVLYLKKDTDIPYHAVLLVGWKEGFWTIRNSYDDKWGTKGYGKVVRASHVAKGEINPIKFASHPFL